MVRILLIILLTCSTKGFCQVELVSNEYAKGYLKDGIRVSHWEYYDSPGELALKINHDNGKVIFLKNDDSPYVIRKDSVWVEQTLEVYPRVIGSYLIFYDYLSERLEYPNSALNKLAQGYMYFSFEVNKAGVPENMVLEQDICDGCGEEVLSLVEEALKVCMPSWIPAQIDGECYPSKFLLPIKFELNNAKNKNVHIASRKPLPKAKNLSEIVIIKNGNISSKGSETKGVQLNLDGSGLFKYYDLDRALEAGSLAKFLYLNSKNLSVLPDDITTLQNLKILDLANNQLRALPEEVHRLTSLEELLLDNNQINSLPKAFHKLDDLTVLSLINNDLEGFPKQVCEIKSLRALDLSDNLIKQIPPEIKSLKKLEVLAIVNCGIKELPEELYKFKSLKKLHIDSKALNESQIIRVKSELPNTEIIIE